MPNEEYGHDERLRELRDRLYSRGAPPPERTRRGLQDQVYETPKTWDIEELTATKEETPAPEPEPLLMKHKRRSYRTTLVVAGLIFFAVALILSGSFLLFGRNTISGENITITADGPLAVGGGEELALNVKIENHNAVPIESATLIVEYPYGTQSPDEEGKELFRDRKPLERLNPGTSVEVPLRARVFGEENEEKTVKISIEYRIEGSNATFFKEAELLRFKISSSPVVIEVENVEKSSSGQEVELEVTISSNSKDPLNEVLLKAEYPSGFDFIEATPGAISGRDTWSFTELEPSEKRTMTLKGTLNGKQDETKIFRFSIGIPNDRDRFSLASIFMTATEEIGIENPFLDLKVSINGDTAEQVAVTPGSRAQVNVTFTNTLSTTIYDGSITVDLSGNGLNDSQVETLSGGFYDSGKDTITWSPGDTSALKSIAPGKSNTVSFVVTPDAAFAARTPQVNFSVSAQANRVGENNASQTLRGTISRSIKVASAVELSSAARYSSGAFTNTGPVPPVVGEVTTYGIRLHVKNGSNAATEGAITLSLPSYVTWLGLTTNSSVFTYNPLSREVSVKIGDLKAGEAKEEEFQISFRPSASQVGQVVNLAGPQRFRATDRFTGTSIQAEASALTTQLVTDPRYEQQDGRVREEED